MAKKDKGALRPDFSVRPFLKQKVVEDIKTITKDEETLAIGSETAFWKVLEKHFDNAIDKLEQINEDAMTKGATMEQIGQNTIIINLTKGVLREIKNSVRYAKEALDERGGTK